MNINKIINKINKVFTGDTSLLRILLYNEISHCIVEFQLIDFSIDNNGEVSKEETKEIIKNVFVQEMHMFDYANELLNKIKNINIEGVEVETNIINYL